MSFSYSDAWIFASIKQDDTPITTILMHADVLNHAIPTYNEFRLAVSKLFSHDLIEHGVHGLRLTMHGNIVSAAGNRRRGGLFQRVENMLKALNSPHIKQLLTNRRADGRRLTSRAFDNACRQYHSMSQELISKLTNKR